MEVTAEHITAAGGALAALIAQSFAVIKYLDGKSSERYAELSQRTEQAQSTLRSDVASHVIEYKRGILAANERINGVKDTYVKQSDHDKDFDAIRDSLKDFRSEIKQDLATSLSIYNQGIRDLQANFTSLLKERG